MFVVASTRKETEQNIVVLRYNAGEMDAVDTMQFFQPCQCKMNREKKRGDIARYQETSENYHKRNITNIL